MKWPNFIVKFPLLLKILGNICIVIIFFSDYDVIKFEINLSFFIMPFFHIVKNVRTKIQISGKQKFKYLPKNRLRPEKVPLSSFRIIKNNEKSNFIIRKSFYIFLLENILNFWYLWVAYSYFFRLWELGLQGILFILFQTKYHFGDC